MGIIARQTIKGSIYSYLGAFIGFINVAIIMPQIFNTDQIGLTNLLVALSTIFGQFGSLGMVNVTIRQFPYFRDEKKANNGFVFFAIAVGSLGFILTSIIYYFTKTHIIESNIEKSPLFAEYVYLLLPFIFITIFYYIIDTYNRLLFNASFGLFVKELFLRLINLVTIVLFWFKFIDFHQFILLYTISYAVPVILICVLLIYKKQFSLKPSFEIFTKKFSKEVFSVAMFGLISGFSGLAVLQLDRYLVNYYCDLSATGIYSTVYFFGSVILLPGRSLIRISSTLIAESIKKNEWDNIKDIYSKSTTSLLTIGMALFVLIWGNIENILKILPKEYEAGRYVILFIGIAHLLQMIASVSSEIIQSSKYYKQFTALMVILILAIIIFNIILLPIYGITGASIASALAFFIFLIIRIIFIYKKFKLNPFKFNHLGIILVGILAIFISMFIPQLKSFIIDAILRSLTLMLIFLGIVYILKLYPEFNINLKKNLVKINNFLRKQQ